MSDDWTFQWLNVKNKIVQRVAEKTWRKVEQPISGCSLSVVEMLQRRILQFKFALDLLSRGLNGSSC